MFYEKLTNRISNGDRHQSFSEVAFENQQTFGEGDSSTRNGISMESLLLQLNQYCSTLEISLEEEDPFADIGSGTGEDLGADENTGSSSDDNPFEDVGSEDDTPFGDLGDDSGTDNPFGDMGGEDDGGFFADDEEDSEKKAPKEVKLNRNDAIKEEHDLSTQIRTNFSKKFLELQDRIHVNIGIIDRTVVYHPRLTDLLERIKSDYNKIQLNIQNFGQIVVNKTYEEIFQKYVEIHTQMMKLKQLYLDAIAMEK